MARKRPEKRPLWQHAAATSVLVVWSLAACGPEQRPDPCPLDMPAPPFRLTVDTAQPVLSPELQIHIVYGGTQTETYHPGDPSSSADICCATFGPSSDIPERVSCAHHGTDAATNPTMVVCDLWTGGAANLTIKAGQQVYAEQTLQAVPRVDIPESCGLFETVEAHWTYGLADAGVAIQ